MVTRAEKREQRFQARFQACQSMGRAMEDEEAGIRMYKEMAENLRHAGMKGPAKMVKRFAKDEMKHLAGLKKMSNRACINRRVGPRKKRKPCPKGRYTRGKNKGKCRK